MNRRQRQQSSDDQNNQQQSQQQQQRQEPQQQEDINRLINLARRIFQNNRFFNINNNNRMADNHQQNNDQQEDPYFDVEGNNPIWNEEDDDDESNNDWIEQDDNDDDDDDNDIIDIVDFDEFDDEDDDDDNEIEQEELNNNNDNNSNENENNRDYDISLPIEHSYLGGLNSIDSARRLFQPGSIVSLKTLYLNGMYLIPGQEIPLTFSNHVTLQFITRILSSTDDNTRTFGIRIGRFDDRFGTTAEIRSFIYKNDEQTITIKVLGRQRFLILEDRNNEYCEYQPNVKILPDIDMHNYFHSIIQKEYKCSNNKRNNLKLLTSLSINSYKQYDNNYLMKKLKTILMKIFEYRIKNDEFNYPIDANAFSYFILMTIPFPDTIKTKLLKIDCINLRLRLELLLLNENFKFICGTCQQNLCDRNSFLVMSKLGTSGTFVNNHGIVHELYTFSMVENIRRVSLYSEDFSWFPNYGWIIINCKRCRAHLGWEFQTHNPNIVPKKFWALTKNSIRLTFQFDVNNQNEDLSIYKLFEQDFGFNLPFLNNNDNNNNGNNNNNNNNNNSDNSQEIIIGW